MSNLFAWFLEQSKCTTLASSCSKNSWHHHQSIKYFSFTKCCGTVFRVLSSRKEYGQVQGGLKWSQYCQVAFCSFVTLLKTSVKHDDISHHSPVDVCDRELTPVQIHSSPVLWQVPLILSSLGDLAWGSASQDIYYPVYLGTVSACPSRLVCSFPGLDERWHCIFVGPPLALCSSHCQSSRRTLLRRRWASAPQLCHR